MLYSMSSGRGNMMLKLLKNPSNKHFRGEVLYARRLKTFELINNYSLYNDRPM